jgi:hypothetical protein
MIIIFQNIKFIEINWSISLLLARSPTTFTQKLHAVFGMMQKAIITNLELKYSEIIGLCMSRVGLNLISQHIKLRGKTNKYALFSPFTNLYLRTGDISKLNFICSIRFIAQFIKQASSQISYVSILHDAH